MERHHHLSLFVAGVLLAILIVVLLPRSTQHQLPVRGPTAGSGAPAAPSTAAAPALVSRPEIGFASRERLLEHYRKHRREFGEIAMEDYLRLAQELRDRAAGGDVLEVVRPDGVVTRFDRSSGAFLAFNSDLTIRTFFKPNDGEEYFRRQLTRTDGGR